MHLANFFGIRHADTDVANHSTSPHTRQPSPGKARVVLYLAIGMSMMCRWHIGVRHWHVEYVDAASMQRDSLYAISTHGIRCTTSSPSP